jgi:SagB-type dehydrogenase family enzyme
LIRCREEIQNMIRVILTISALLLIFIMGMASGLKQRPATDRSIGGRFHDETSLTWREVIGDIFRSRPDKPGQYKDYPGAERIKLPNPDYQGRTVEEAIKARRSVRNYSDKTLSMQQLSQLLFAAQGITGSMHGQLLRTAPSAGALYPFEVYVAVHNIEGLPRGIYHYGVREHELQLVKRGDFRDEITSAGLKQDMLGHADATFILSALFDRTGHKYGERGYRYVYMEAGHISQNIALQAVSLGLGSVSVGAFIDDAVNELVGIDGIREAALYLHAVGTL